jgi:putative hydrolase of the HAD superfamily
VGGRHGLELDPARYDEARAAALELLQRHPELEHDDEIWVAFTTRIVEGMGGAGERARRCAEDMVAAWERHEYFTLYEDALPVLEELRRHGIRIGLVSNSGRDIAAFVAHHALAVDAAIVSRDFGRTKPHPSIFEAVLAQLGVAAGETAMVGDSYEDDIEGARALGIRAFLLDRDGRHPEERDRLPDLLALPAALGLPSSPPRPRS